MITLDLSDNQLILLKVLLNKYKDSCSKVYHDHENDWGNKALEEIAENMEMADDILDQLN